MKSFDSMVENSYSFCADYENMGIPRSPNLGGRDINFLLMSEQFIPPVIAGMNSVLTTSTNCLSWFLMFGIVLMKYIGLCLNLLEAHAMLFYTAHATLLSIDLFFLDHIFP